MSELKQQYHETIMAKLKDSLKKENEFAVPRLEKIIVNVGTGKALKDGKLLDIMIENLKKITGQAPVKRKAKTSISNFGIREGMTVGLQVTLRGDRMYDFLQRLIRITLPRVRDFAGVSNTAFDGQGNYNLGFKEHVVFPETASNDIQQVHGLGITIKTTATNDEEARALLKELGLPFSKENNK